MKSLRLALLALPLLTLLPACSPYWYRHDDAFVVQNSRLNWLQVYYQASEDAPRVRCDYKDNGSIIVLEGHSVTVGDDFNIEYDKAAFGDVRKYHYTLDPQMFREYLQVLVDCDLMKYEEPRDDTPIYPKVMVRANINHHRVEKFTFNPDLIAELRTQIFQFKLSGLRNQ